MEPPFMMKVERQVWKNQNDNRPVIMSIVTDPDDTTNYCKA